MHVGDDHWLVVDEEGLPAVTKLPSTRTTPLQGAAPLGVVWHWTGGVCRGPGAAQALAEEIRTYDASKDRPASWHVVIAKDGRMIQSVPFNLGSWHVGKPGRIGAMPAMVAGKWDATAWQGGTLFGNINRATIGIELLNAGRLEKVADRFYSSPWWLNPDHPELGPDLKLEIEPARAVLVGAKWFDEFPAAQVDAAQRLLTALLLKYKLPKEATQYGHVMFDPARKEDPGPLWLETHLPRIIQGVFGA